MKNSILYIFVTTLLFLSCNTTVSDEDRLNLQKESEQTFVTTMQKHLDAVTNRDLESLKSTLSPNGEMQLILPSTEIIYKVSGFMEYHEDWFADDSWTFETKMLNTDIGDKMGMAITEIVYREPKREGGPYTNRMIVSYDLKKIDGTWYIIKDHASSIEVN